ncbi:MAG: hypothetical protein NTZ33_14500 [Bacteroidetes bacterium]|nr:hypothetical protein [Bacteroidota bacterium]
MKKLWIRFVSETPVIWKKVRSVVLWLGGAFVALITVNSTLNLGLLPIIITIAKYGIGLCAFIASTAQFQTTGNNG